VKLGFHEYAIILKQWLTSGPPGRILNLQLHNGEKMLSGFKLNTDRLCINLNQSKYDEISNY
jgi:hypothetical protein